MVDQSGWSVRNKLNEFFAKENHVRLAKNQISKARVDAGALAPFSPAILFAAGEQGAWFEPSPTTCFTDTARTTPASVGQAVAGMTDLSGRGNHATQDITSARPILRQAGTGEFYLEFDGIDDSMVTPTITPGINKAQAFAGVRLSSGTGVILETSVNNNTNAGSLLLLGGQNFGVLGNVYSYTFTGRGTTVPSQSSAAQMPATLAPNFSVLTATGDISAPINTLRRNAVNGTSSTNSQGSGNFLAYPAYIGSRAGTSTRFNGHIYSLILRFGANITNAQLIDVENYVANLTEGVTLP
jgi:hypothetical protein